jgi:hypothetical protein
MPIGALTQTGDICDYCLSTRRDGQSGWHSAGLVPRTCDEPYRRTDLARSRDGCAKFARERSAREGMAGASNTTATNSKLGCGSVWEGRHLLAWGPGGP